MPIYVFQCNADHCGKIFESLSQPYDPVSCPHCGCNSATKQVTAHSNCGINTMKNPALKEAKRKEGKRERITEFCANEGKWGSSQKHD